MTTAAVPTPALGARARVLDRPTTERRPAILAAAVVCAAVWCALCYLPELSSRPTTSAVAIMVAVGFAAAAVVVAAQPGRRGAGIVLAATCVLWPLNSLGGWDAGPAPFARQVAECFFWVLVPVGVLLYQNPRWGGWERLFVGWITLEFVGGQLLWTALSRPEWSGLPADAWWPSLAPDPALFEITRDVLAALYAPSVLAFAVLLLWRGRRGAPVDRYSIAPVVVAVAGVGVAAGFSWSVFERTTVIVAVALLPLPVAFVYSATRLARLRLRLSEALDTAPVPSATAPRATVTSALRTVLRDPDLAVTFWSAERGEWIGETGEVRAPGPGADQVEIPVVRSDGRLCAVVCTQATSLAARREVEAAVRLAGTVIENAGLRAVVQAQAEAVGRAHARTVQAGVEERRRLEQDLHDGAQQRLLGVLTLLAAARQDTVGETGESTVGRAQTEVRAALAELRDLAHGLHPTVLTRDGLPDALADLGERLALPVEVQVRVGRLEPALETSIYYVVSEALTNIHKHAGAERAWVRVAPGDVGVDVDVRDDGVGGADPAGAGLRGLADRVIALGGRFTLHSPAGAGTHVRAWMPCG
ncbi:sensor histidine kinase [Actinomycetospora sp. C-140]